MRQRGAKARTDAADHDYFFLEHSGHGYPNILAAICCWRNALRREQHTVVVLPCSKCGKDAGRLARSTNSTVGPFAAVRFDLSAMQNGLTAAWRCPSVSTQLVT